MRGDHGTVDRHSRFLITTTEADAQGHLGKEARVGGIQGAGEVDGGGVAGADRETVQDAKGGIDHGRERGTRVHHDQGLAVLGGTGLSDSEVVNAAGTSVYQRLDDGGDIRTPHGQAAAGRHLGHRGTIGYRITSKVTAGAAAARIAKHRGIQVSRQNGGARRHVGGDCSALAERTEAIAGVADITEKGLEDAQCR